MMDYLGEDDIAKAIFKATEEVINENKYVTYDLGGNATLSKMTDKIAQLSARNLRK
jgi:isocitrate dehydrogenase (NAD+)